MQVRFIAEMLNVNPWRMYPLTVQVLHEKCEDYWKGVYLPRLAVVLI